MFVEFSYTISEETTVQEKAIRPPAVSPRSRLSNGDRSNTSYFELFAHAGTHIDSPWHFIPEGSKITDLDIAQFVFERVVLVTIAKKPDEEVTLEDLLPWKEQIEKSDLLLIHTGFSDYRSSDPQTYLTQTPGLSIRLAEWLASLQGLKCIGVDFSSIENIPRARLEGYPIHHALLGRKEPMILLEDANLAALINQTIKRVYLFPLRITGLEASPVTAVAEL